MSTYDELLEKVKAIDQAHQSKAKEYIPKMYWALRNEDSNVTSEDARDRIEKDCVGIWSKRTLLDALPDEAKDLKKQKAGRIRQKEANSAALTAAPSSNRKTILLENNGSEETDSPEGKQTYSIEDKENVLKEGKECKNCTILQKRNDNLRNQILDYEQVVSKASPVITADKIHSDNKNGDNSPIYINNINNVLTITHYFQWPELQKHMQEIFRAGRPLIVWFSLRVEKETGKVLEAYLGSNNREENNVQGDLRSGIL